MVIFQTQNCSCLLSLSIGRYCRAVPSPNSVLSPDFGRGLGPFSSLEASLNSDPSSQVSPFRLVYLTPNLGLDYDLAYASDHCLLTLGYLPLMVIRHSTVLSVLLDSGVLFEPPVWLVMDL